jgi:hypothetical protein
MKKLKVFLKNLIFLTKTNLENQNDISYQSLSEIFIF